MRTEHILLSPDPPFPNNDVLPLLLYRGVADPAAEAAWFETVFARNGWTGSWRNGVYGYHHFHSTAHEVLGCYGGQATVRFGGPEGPEVTFGAGDAVVIPAGVGHCLVRSGRVPAG